MGLSLSIWNLKLTWLTIFLLAVSGSLSRGASGRWCGFRAVPLERQGSRGVHSPSHTCHCWRAAPGLVISFTSLLPFARLDPRLQVEKALGTRAQMLVPLRLGWGCAGYGIQVAACSQQHARTESASFPAHWPGPHLQEGVSGSDGMGAKHQQICYGLWAYR